jgi:hypothetical protein
VGSVVEERVLDIAMLVPNQFKNKHFKEMC